jgi:hypothetical protein
LAVPPFQKGINISNSVILDAFYSTATSSIQDRLCIIQSLLNHYLIITQVEVLQMLLPSRNEFLSSIFTIIKLGAAGIVLFLLITKFVSMWQANEGQIQIREATKEMTRPKAQ